MDWSLAIWTSVLALIKNESIPHGQVTKSLFDFTNNIRG